MNFYHDLIKIACLNNKSGVRHSKDNSQVNQTT